MAKVALTGGLFQDASGLPLSNGYLTMALSHDEQETADPGQVVGGLRLRISLDENGNITGNPQVWPNDQLLPSGSCYEVLAFRQDAVRVWKSPQFWTITGTSPVNVGTIIPTSPPGCGCGGASGINFADEEFPSGAINGANTTFTLVRSPNPSKSLLLFLNGVLLEQGIGDDYTLSGGAITMSIAPLTGDILLAWYRY